MSDYSDVIEASVKKEIDVLGDRALEIARENGVETDESGNVRTVTGDGEEVLEDLIDSYTDISGNLAATLIAREIEDMDTSGLELPESLSQNL
ncbi:MAG: hypothetical protein ABEK01_00410 [Candidatus Nanohaloarchaea archaeon]